VVRIQEYEIDEIRTLTSKKSGTVVSPAIIKELERLIRIYPQIYVTGEHKTEAL